MDWTKFKIGVIAGVAATFLTVVAIFILILIMWVKEFVG